MNQDLVNQFHTEISNRAAEVDPSNEQDWYSISLGWAIAKGLTPELAHEFAIDIRYKTQLG